MKLLKTEKGVIVQHILDLDAQGFLPWLAAVKDMADSLLAEQHHDPVSQKFQNKAANFVKRQPELKVNVVTSSSPSSQHTLSLHALTHPRIARA
jgi:hypothetical protein